VLLGGWKKINSLASRLTLLAKAFSFAINATVIAFPQQQKLPLVLLS